MLVSPVSSAWPITATGGGQAPSSRKPGDMMKIEGVLLHLTQSARWFAATPSLDSPVSSASLHPPQAALRLRSLLYIPEI